MNLNRRQFLGHTAAWGLCGLGHQVTAFADGSATAGSPLPAWRTHAPRAKRVIFLFMNGGPSHLDLFDPKPALKKYAGQRPGSVDIRTERKTGGLLPSIAEFRPRGKSGVEVSDLLPWTSKVIDDICVIRSVYGPIPTHTPASNFMHSGNIALTRPSIGAWVNYGLGSENSDMPGFIALAPGGGPNAGGATLWRSGFLPGQYGGTHIDHSQNKLTDMVPNSQRTQGDPRMQLDQLKLVTAANGALDQSFGFDPAFAARTKTMQTAYRMQTQVGGIFDLDHESPEILAAYGPGKFAKGCLLARRLVESGVRYVHLYYDGGQPWDHHGNIAKALPVEARNIDQATYALITDLKQRGLLDDTLVIWGGEFGRTPVSEGGNGRDHNPFGYTMWMAGGGIKGGMAYGATDEFGFKAVQDRVSVHDIHATILHQLGIDHEKFTYRYSGRDFRLTDVHGEVIHKILA